jgi:hypothetical protein
MLFLSALSCEISFDNGIRVSYALTGTTVRFTYNMQSSIYEKWAWVGFGLKHAADGSNMVNGDYVSIIVHDLLIEDRTGGVRNGRPKTDDQVGGLDSLSNEAMRMDPDFSLNFLWDRELNTGDSVDVQLVPGQTYYAQWAVGEVANGVLKHHVDKGYKLFTFGVCEEDKFLGIN